MRNIPGIPKAQDRRQQAWALRLQGYSIRAIGEALGVSHTAVEKMLNHTIDELHKSELNDAESVRSLELERLDTMFAGLWGKAVAGDTFAVTQAINIMARRAKLLGLDAPVKGALTDTRGNDIGVAITFAAASLNSRLAQFLEPGETESNNPESDDPGEGISEL